MWKLVSASHVFLENRNGLLLQNQGGHPRQRIASLGGSRYYVTFIDDSTRKVWVYFLKNKSDVFVTFKKWKTEVENQTGLKIKSLISDIGGEYSSDEFKSYCAEYGIRMIKTIPETPQQNGFDSSYIILLLYVDDMLIAGSNMREINKLKRQMSEEFEMKDMGAAKQILGMSIMRDRSEGTLKLSQEKYIGKLLEKFSIQDAKTRSTPLAAHFNLTKKQSPKMDEDKEYMAKKDVILEGFSDADLGGCLDTRKSTTGYIFTLGGTAVSWMSRLQKSVALSTTEAEYMAISEASKEMICLSY
ncbi:hypothetical protein DCAR_0209691 [Daucus carota subsp. sativus]|uniref:Integrase catalytic domain-containing protein n=1 Tax=Daucus carota subsp. sativus TaxID=79200 RepID=A0AAF0WJ24_DAUCS|nr:hypothetical protein DCAR_0209691 [Daucus carota subsp. sativus]